MDPATLRLGDAEIDLSRRQVRTPRGASSLTPLEARLLGFLAERTGRFVARQELLTEVWGYAQGVSTRAVDNTVSRLRRKIEPEPATPQWITSTRGAGYRLVAEARGVASGDAQPECELSTAEIAHNLPDEADRFVGRADALARIAAALDRDARLVSIVGFGGVGKTRTALRAAREALGRFGGGCWFCDLTHARDAHGIYAAVAGALSIPALGADPETQIGHALASLGRGLLLLDNFEQLVPWASTLSRWRALAPALTQLVTSRAVLGAPDEAQIELGPMSVAEAADLFTARASELYRGALGDRETVERLVGMLDGLPLAVELAAVRVRVMGPAAIVARMGERFRLLASCAPESGRHGTLRAILDQSWDLASDADRAVLAQISVFEGAFTAAEAAAVAALDAVADPPPIAHVLDSLVDQSLARRRAGGRYDLLVTVREYAQGRLESTERAAVEARHGELYAALGADDVLDSVHRTGGPDRLDALTEAVPNLLAASRRAVERGDAVVAARTARAAWKGSRRQGPVGPAIRALEHALGMGHALSVEANVHIRIDLLTGYLYVGRRADAVVADALDGARADGRGALLPRALVAASKHEATWVTLDRGLELAREAGDAARAAQDRSTEGAALAQLGKLLVVRGSAPEARPALEGALAAYREVGDRFGEGAVLADLGLLEAALGSAEQGWSYIEQALAVHQELGDRQNEAAALNLAGKVHGRLGRTAAAARCYRAALSVFRELGDVGGVSITLRHVGNLWREQGRFAEARAAYEEGRAIARQVGNRRTEATHGSNLAAMHTELGEYDLARVLYLEIVPVYRELGMTGSEGVALGNLGELELMAGRLTEARALFEASAALHRGRDARNTGTALKRLASLDRLEGRLDRAREQALEALALACGLGDRRYEAMALHELAQIALAAGDLDEAGQRLEAAERLARERDDRLMIALILCTQAELELTAGLRVRAEASLDRIESLVPAGFGPRSEIRVLIDALRARSTRPR